MKARIISSIVFVAIIGVMATCLGIGSAAAGDVDVIANATVSVSSLNATEIKSIFLGKKTQWEGGQRIIFVVLKGDDVHKMFLKKYVKKTPSQFKNYWRKQVFTGKGKSPTSFSTQKELIEYVANTNGSIGYVSSGSDTGAAKTINVD